MSQASIRVMEQTPSGTDITKRVPSRLTILANKSKMYKGRPNVTRALRQHDKQKKPWYDRRTKGRHAEKRNVGTADKHKVDTASKRTPQKCNVLANELYKKG